MRNEAYFQYVTMTRDPETQQMQYFDSLIALFQIC